MKSSDLLCPNCKNKLQVRINTACNESSSENKAVSVLQNDIAVTCSHCNLTSFCDEKLNKYRKNIYAHSMYGFQKAAA